MAVLAVVAGLVAVLGWAIGSPPLQATGVVVLAFFGIGTATVQFSKLDMAGYIAVGLASSLTILILGSWTMVELPLWHPAWAFLVVSVAALAAHLRLLQEWTQRRVPQEAVRAAVLVGVGGPPIERQEDQPSAPQPRGPGRIQISLSLILSGLGVLFWISAALVSRHIVPGVGGFPTQIFPSWYLGPACLLAALVTARRDREYEAATAVVLLALCFSTTVEIVYDGIRSPTASLHVAVIQQIRADRRVHPHLNIYNAWPGFFTSIAWIADAGHIEDPYALVRWWPALIGLFRLAEFRYLAGKILAPGYRCWVAALLGLLADTIGADYFSPQSLGFVLALAIYALAIAHRDESPIRVRWRLTFLFGLSVAVAVTHQLSPYMAVATVVVLTAFQVVRPWWTPGLLIGPTLGWTIVNWDWVKTFVHLNDVGQASNFSPPRQSGLVGLTRSPIIRATEFALLAGLVVLAVAAVGWFLRNRRTSLAWGLGCCCAAPLVTVAANAYGNEGIYRAILFAAPWMALMASAVYVRHRWVLGATSIALLATNLVGSYGLDAVDTMAPADLAAITRFSNEAPPNSLILTAGRYEEQPVSPTLNSADFARTNWAVIDPTAPELIAGSDPSLVVARMSIRLALRNQSGLDTIWYWISPVSIEYDKLYALATPAQDEAYNSAVVHSGYWTERFSRSGTVLLQMTGWPLVLWHGYRYRVSVAGSDSTVGSVAALFYGHSRTAIATLDHYNPGFGRVPARSLANRAVIAPLSTNAPILPIGLVS